MTVLASMMLLACGSKAVPPASIGPVAEPVSIVAAQSVLTADGEAARLDLRIQNDAPWTVTLSAVDYSVTIGPRQFNVTDFDLSRPVTSGTAAIVRLDAGVPEGAAPAEVSGTLYWTGPMAAQQRSTAFDLQLPVTEVVQ